MASILSGMSRATINSVWGEMTILREARWFFVSPGHGVGFLTVAMQSCYYSDQLALSPDNKITAANDVFTSNYKERVIIVAVIIVIVHLFTMTVRDALDHSRRVIVLNLNLQ